MTCSVVVARFARLTFGAVHPVHLRQSSLGATYVTATEREGKLYFLALATDYDGTIAHHGVVDEATMEALRALKETGRLLILITGRELPDLRRVVSALDVFDRVVAENGALLYNPATQEEHLLAPPAPDRFVEALRARHVSPLSVGSCIVATWEPNEKVVLEAIRDLGLEFQVTFNKGAVMVLPAGVNKASGLAAALKDLELSPLNVIGVGDAENDHAFLKACGCSAAVANALPAVKENVDIDLKADHGAGVAELISLLCSDEGTLVPSTRHAIVPGWTRDGEPLLLGLSAGGVLIAGQSGIGKSTIATALTEQMFEQGLEFCVFDPEGDYSELANAIVIGDAKTVPNLGEAERLLRSLSANVVLNTQAMSLSERPAFFASLLPRLSTLRARTGRPHWLIVDEAHHLLAVERGGIAQVLPEQIPAVIFITVHPNQVSAVALRNVDHVLALGDDARETIASFCRQLGIPAPESEAELRNGEALYWRRSSGRRSFPIRPASPKQSHRRHTRKYAEGDLGEDLSFYFRGAEGKLNLRAQNLVLFAQIAEGVDESTWDYHRRRGDYSLWFQNVIKDEDLARETATVEGDVSLDAVESRRRILAAIARRYTAPARDRGS